METKSDKTIIDNKVIREMVETEKTYNIALTLLHSALSIKDNVKGNKLLLEFEKIVTILKTISDTLLLHAIKAVDITVTEDAHRSFRTQRTQLLKAFFEAYKPYAQLFNQYLSESANNQEPFKAINLYLIKNSAARLDLASHLVQPIQRGPRYAMLVNATRKMNAHLTETNISEFEAVEALIANNLLSINSELPPSSNPYWFGKITYTLLFGNQSPSSTPLSAPVTTVSEPAKPGFKFSDFTRSFFSVISPGEEKKSDASSSKDKVDEKLDETFVMIDSDDIKDAPKGDNNKTEDNNNDGKSLSQ
jgi:hypothetical protein